MIYIFGLAIILLIVLTLWIIRLAVYKFKVFKAQRDAKKNPTLPLYEPEPPASFTVQTQTFLDGILPPDPRAIVGGPPRAYGTGPGAPRERFSIYSVYQQAPAVHRAHPECASDPDLPKYTEDPTASRPAILTYEEFPPPPTPPPELEAGAILPPSQRSAIATGEAVITPPPPAARRKSRRESFVSALLIAAY